MSVVKGGSKVDSDNRLRAEKKIQQHMCGAFAVGLIPLPFIDIAALTLVQLHLVRKISKIYRVPFFHNGVRNMVSSLLAGAFPAVVGPSVASTARMVPGIGVPLGVISVPFVAAASTYALGELFVQQFESGGNLLTLEIERAKSRFSGLFARGVVATEVNENSLSRVPQEGLSLTAHDRTVPDERIAVEELVQHQDLDQGKIASLAS